MAGISLRCLKVLSPFWTTSLRCCDSSPTHNPSGLRSIRATTMAATSPIDSVWSQTTMRLCRLSLRRPLAVLTRQLVVALPLAVLSLHCPLVLSLCRLVATSPLLILMLCRPLILLSCRLVVVLPLDTPPSRHLIVSSCRLSLSHHVSWFSHHHLSLFSRCTALLFSCSLIVLAGCWVASPFTALLSSRRSSPLPTPSNAVKRCCRHRTPPPPPPLKAVSIVHHCHSCHPSPPSNDNAHLCPSPPSKADACRRHPTRHRGCQSPLSPFHRLSIAPTAVTVKRQRRN